MHITKPRVTQDLYISGLNRKFSVQLFVSEGNRRAERG